MTSEEILAEWQRCLDTMHRTPPNEEHAAASARIDELVPLLAEATAREDDARAAASKAIKEDVVARAAALSRQSGPNVEKIIYDARIALFGMTRAIGPDAALAQCERAIADCLEDDKVQ